MKTKILLIDDDIVSVPHVADELRLCGFNVETMVESSQIARLLTRQRAFPADFLILDVMIPSAGLYSASEAQSGLYTGLLLARDIRAKWPHVPILLWSAAPLERVRTAAAGMAKRISNCRFVSKGARLENVIEAYFKHGRFTQNWPERLWGALTFRPGIGGIALDIKKLGGNDRT